MSVDQTLDAGPATTWRDRKRYLWAIGVVMPAIPFAAIGLYAWTGWGVWMWLGPIVILGIVPVVDVVTGIDRSNPPDDVIAALEADRYYRWITYLFLPVQYAAFVVGFWVIADGGLTTVESVGLAVTLGFVGGLGINTAHELGHKRDATERWLARIALAQTAYGHFYIEHNRGHHVRVATPEDPASSRLGESFYRFWPRTVAGSLASAWRLEKRRLARRGRHPYRLSNDVLNAWLMTLVLWAALVAWLGVGIVPYLVLQAIVGLTLLEAVNYLEHYGLLRQRVGRPGSERYERVEPRHSWNSNNVATNVLLYHLQRHSDHHANPTRRYQALRDVDSAPVLPTGYAGMILLALVPPAWRRVMDPRVLAHYDGDLGLANVTPRRRAALELRHGVASGTSHVEASAPAGNGTTADGSSAPGTAPVRAVAPAAPAAVHQCPGCGYVYDEATGAPREGFPAGTPWTQVPATWCCPDCGVREKVDFIAVARAAT